MSLNSTRATEAQVQLCNPTEEIGSMNPARSRQMRDMYLVADATDTANNPGAVSDLITNPCNNWVGASQDSRAQGDRNIALATLRSDLQGSNHLVAGGSDNEVTGVGNFVAGSSNNIAAGTTNALLASSNIDLDATCQFNFFAGSAVSDVDDSVGLAVIQSNNTSFLSAERSVVEACGGVNIVSSNGCAGLVTNGINYTGSTGVSTIAGSNHTVTNGFQHFSAASSIETSFDNTRTTMLHSGFSGLENSGHSSVFGGLRCFVRDSNYSAVLQSYDSECVNGSIRSAVISSLRTLADGQQNALIGGFGAGAPTVANATWKLNSINGQAILEGGVSAGPVTDYAYYQENLEKGVIPDGTGLVYEYGQDNHTGIKVRVAKDGEYLDSAITAIAAIKLNDSPFEFQGRHIRDEFGRFEFEDQENPEIEDLLSEIKLIKESVIEGDKRSEKQAARQIKRLEKQLVSEIKLAKESVIEGDKRSEKQAARQIKKLEKQLARVQKNRPTISVKKINPDHKPELEKDYTPRSERPEEWSLCIHTGYVFVRVDENVRPTDLLIGGDGVARTMAADEEAKMPRRKKMFEVTRIPTPYSKEKGYGVAMVQVR